MTGETATDHATNPIAAALSAKSAWPMARVLAFLDEAHLPLRLATRDAAGYPHITSLWFLHEAGRLFCCTQRSALAARHIALCAQVGFELAVNEPPYHGLTGHGDARFVQRDAGALLEQLIARYLADRNPRLRAWLLSRLDTEVVIEIAPLHLTTWDFRRRMAPEH